MDEVIYSMPIPSLFLQAGCFSILFLCFMPVIIYYAKRRFNRIPDLLWNIFGCVMVGVAITVVVLIVNQKISEGLHRSAIVVGEKSIKETRTPKNAVAYTYTILPTEINAPYFVVNDAVWNWIDQGGCYQFTYYGRPGKVEFSEITEIRHVEMKRCK